MTNPYSTDQYAARAGVRVGVWVRVLTYVAPLVCVLVSAHRAGTPVA